jgi:hypothetical protein
MNYLPDDELRDPNKPKPPSMTRIAIWVIVGGFGAYLVISGILGILAKGS